MPIKELLGNPPNGCLGWARVVVLQITNVPVLHSDEVHGGRVPGIHVESPQRSVIEL